MPFAPRSPCSWKRSTYPSGVSCAIEPLLSCKHASPAAAVPMRQRRGAATICSIGTSGRSSAQDTAATTVSAEDNEHGRPATTTALRQKVKVAHDAQQQYTQGGAVTASVDEALHIAEESLQDRPALCDSGLPDPDMCLIDETEVKPPQELTVWGEAVTRGRWLLGLLVLQSTSSFVLDSYQDLLKEHIVVTLFLTMLVGAGGNAGNQSAIKVIRGLATGSITTSWNSIKETVTEQMEVALLLGTGLAGAGFVRVYITNGGLLNSIAISLSLLAIVMTSVVLGSGLPFCLARLGVDPAHAGTSIQVLMDIIGVLITCATCNFILVQFATSLAI